MSDGVVMRGGTELSRGAEIIANHEARSLIPGFGGRISAVLVWDGTDEVRVPQAMGTPRADQMQGTARERLVELCGRVCYDAMGVGRATDNYFEHILQVGHYSIMEHAAVTVELTMGCPTMFAIEFLNRPGVWVVVSMGQGTDHRVRVTINPRVLTDWGRHGQRTNATGHAAEILLAAVSAKFPRLLAEVFPSNRGAGPSREFFMCRDAEVVEPETDEEKWVSLYMVGSRGWGNELARHRHMSAISQRSTRYVQESESEWVLHPLLAKTIQENGGMREGGLATNVRTALGDLAGRILAMADDERFDEKAEDFVKIGAEIQDYAGRWTGVSQVGMVAQESRVVYEALATKLTSILKEKGVDATSARKQARGAARGMLGLSLETEIVYSASVRSWRHMLSMRAADAADAEIRLQFAEAALPCLRASRYGDRFADLELVPAGDGIGRSLKGGGHK